MRSLKKAIVNSEDASNVSVGKSLTPIFRSNSEPSMGQTCRQTEEVPEPYVLILLLPRHLGLLELVVTAWKIMISIRIEVEVWPRTKITHTLMRIG